MRENNPSNRQRELKAPIVLTEEKFTEVYNRLVPRMLSVIQSKGLDSDTEDIIQETYLAFWLQHRKGKSIRDPEAYIFVVFFKVVAEFCHKRKKNQLLNKVDPEKCQQSLLEDPYLVEELQKEKQDQIEDLKVFIDNHLDEDQQKILRMHYFEGMSLKEISNELGLSYENTRQKSRRAIGKLRNLMS